MKKLQFCFAATSKRVTDPVGMIFFLQMHYSNVPLPKATEWITYSHLTCTVSESAGAHIYQQIDIVECKCALKSESKNGRRRIRLYWRKTAEHRNKRLSPRNKNIFSFWHLPIGDFPCSCFKLALHLNRECVRYWIKTDPRLIARTTVCRITNITTFITWAGRTRYVVSFLFCFKRKTRRLTNAFQSILRMCVCVCVSVSMRSLDWERRERYISPISACLNHLLAL